MTQRTSFSHGGLRPGSGRKTGSGRYAEPTEVIRIPQSAVPAVRAWLDSRAEAMGGVTVQPFTSAPSSLPLPLFGARIAAGFPSPADDHLEDSLDLNVHLVQHPAATFFVRVQGDSMTGAGIYHGDLLVVDRARQAKSGEIVIAVINGELTVKRLKIEGERVWLLPENPHYPALEIRDGMELVIWGVVAHAVRSF
ncbi:MAG: translesion error-prone DNA polymerase V autoproteolytic subunit [Methylococcus sp.]|nr:translesion error-prone DNA polymerase V autoproteolytic subunit [Methylococcus sp.]